MFTRYRLSNITEKYWQSFKAALDIQKNETVTLNNNVLCNLTDDVSNFSPSFSST